MPEAAQQRELGWAWRQLSCEGSRSAATELRPGTPLGQGPPPDQHPAPRCSVPGSCPPTRVTVRADGPAAFLPTRLRGAETGRGAAFPPPPFPRGSGLAPEGRPEAPLPTQLGNHRDLGPGTLPMAAMEPSLHPLTPGLASPRSQGGGRRGLHCCQHLGLICPQASGHTAASEPTAAALGASAIAVHQLGAWARGGARGPSWGKAEMEMDLPPHRTGSQHTPGPGCWAPTRSTALGPCRTRTVMESTSQSGPAEKRGALEGAGRGGERVESGQHRVGPR